MYTLTIIAVVVAENVGENYSQRIDIDGGVVDELADAAACITAIDAIYVIVARESASVSGGEELRRQNGSCTMPGIGAHHIAITSANNGSWFRAALVVHHCNGICSASVADAKVGNFQNESPGFWVRANHENVLRFNVAVYDAAVVQKVQTGGDLTRDVEAIRNRPVRW